MEENQPEMVKCKYSVHFVLCPPDKTCEQNVYSIRLGRKIILT
jgi:hypothetical protein